MKTGFVFSEKVGHLKDGFCTHHSDRDNNSRCRRNSGSDFSWFVNYEHFFAVIYFSGHYFLVNFIFFSHFGGHDFSYYLVEFTSGDNIFEHL